MDTTASGRAELEAALEQLLERIADSGGSVGALERASQRCSAAFERWTALGAIEPQARLDVARRFGLVVRLAQDELARTGARLQRAEAARRALVGNVPPTSEPQACDHRG
ncbi:MAG: hypothetical protein NTV21_02705 [Planctomycetota bacterium]|nr:hypothetical protein [Planctomycetota bacterium]